MPGPICVVDDDEWVRDSISVLLETYGYQVLAYGLGEEFLRANGRGKAKCLVIDQHMPGLNGLEVIAKLHREGNSSPTILITGRLDASVTQRANQLAILAILEKSFATARLIELIRDALRSQD
jgi:FixJ family two-component response regulator